MQRPLTSWVTVAATLIATLTALAAPAAADGTADAFHQDDEIVAVASDAAESTGGPTGSGTNPCRFLPLSDSQSAQADSLSQGGWGNESGDGAGAWYRRICDVGDGQTAATVVWLAEPPQVDPRALAEEALGRAAIPAPAVRLNPPEGQDQVVHLPTWLWIDPDQWQGVSASASAGVVTVTATARPTSVRWDMGNGDVVTCTGPGTPYDPDRSADEQHTDCSYTYRRSSAQSPEGAFTMRVTVSWQVSWSATGIAAGGALPAAERTTSIPVRVAEIQAVNR